VSLANSIGTGVADDKVVYYFVPRIIKYYLDQDPILPNVPTYLASEEEDKKYILEHLPSWWSRRPMNPAATACSWARARARRRSRNSGSLIEADPRNYIAQPMISLSRHPTWCEEDGFEGRHVDLRPFILYGERTTIVPGGLTRVALNKGSLVVNSSQGGGSKDTWVLYD
jgi:uncharacterized circularly permuted ATP-grasp superfamily protein